MWRAAKPPRPSDTPPMLGGAKPPRPSDTPPILGGAKAALPLGLSNLPVSLLIGGKGGAARSARGTPHFYLQSFILKPLFSVNNKFIRS